MKQNKGLWSHIQASGIKYSGEFTVQDFEECCSLLNTQRLENPMGKFGEAVDWIAKHGSDDEIYLLHNGLALRRRSAQTILDLLNEMIQQ